MSGNDNINIDRKKENNIYIRVFSIILSMKGCVYCPKLTTYINMKNKSTKEKINMNKNI